MFARYLSGAAVLALSAGVAQADYALTILHTNDFHDRFEPISLTIRPARPRITRPENASAAQPAW